MPTVMGLGSASTTQAGIQWNILQYTGTLVEVGHLDNLNTCRRLRSCAFSGAQTSWA